MELFLTTLKNSEILKVLYSDKAALANNTKLLMIDSTMTIPMYEGFRYFSPVDISSLEKHTQFICGYVGDIIIGIIKFHRCTMDKYELIGEHDKAAVPNYLEVRYVDVHRRWQNIGVATALIRGFSVWVNQPQTVVFSPLTAEGRKANLLGKFREHLKYATLSARPGNVRALS